MLTQSQILTNLLGEHEVIREQLKRAGEAIKDWQRTMESEIAHVPGVPLELFSDKQSALVQSLDFLEEGLFRHHQREQKEIGPFVGSIGKALIIEQEEIQKELRRMKLLLTDSDLKASSGAELAKKYFDIKNDVEITYQRIYEHSMLDDRILRLLLKASTHTKGK